MMVQISGGNLVFEGDDSPPSSSVAIPFWFFRNPRTPLYCVAFSPLPSENLGGSSGSEIDFLWYMQTEVLNNVAVP